MWDLTQPSTLMMAMRPDTWTHQIKTTLSSTRLTMPTTLTLLPPKNTIRLVKRLRDTSLTLFNSFLLRPRKITSMSQQSIPNHFRTLLLRRRFQTTLLCQMQLFKKNRSQRAPWSPRTKVLPRPLPKLEFKPRLRKWTALWAWEREWWATGAPNEQQMDNKPFI